MNDNMLNILIEVSVFCTLGLLYYLWQKKRIIRADISDIFHKLDKITYDLHHYLNDKKDESDYTNINNIVIELETSDDLAKINSLLLKLPKSLPEEIINQKDSILKQLELHCKN